MESFISKEVNSEEFIDGSLSLDPESKCFCMTIIDQALKRLSVDPTELLIKLIPKVKTVSDFGFLMICLNNGAKTNCYISTEGGNVHIIVYGLMNIQEEFYNLFIYMMIFKGSDPSKKSIKTLDETEMESVKNWCSEYRSLKIPSTQSKAKKYMEKLSEDEQVILKIMFDMSDSYDKKNMTLICCFRTPVFNKVEGDINVKAVLKLFFECGLKKLFLQVIDSGNEVTYSDVCYFISQFSNYCKKPEFQSICEIYKDMLRILAERGVEFDSLQLEELEQIDIPFKMTIEEICKAPIWEKVKHNSKGGKIKDEYYDYGFLLGLAPREDLKILSDLYTNIASVDGSVLVESLRKRHIAKISLETTSIFETVKSHVHIEAPGKDPFNFPEWLVFYYKDKQDKIWPFFYNSFNTIIKSKENPYNSDKLPDYVVTLIKNKYKFLSFLSINKLLSYSDIINSIKEPYRIKQDMQSEFKRRYAKTLDSKGYNSESISNSSIDMLRTRLEEIGIYLESYLAIGKKEKMTELNVSEKFIYSVFLQAIADKISEDSSILNRLRTL